MRTLQSSIEPEEMSGFKNIDDADNEEYSVVMLEDVNEVLEMMQIEEEPPINDEIQLIKTFMNLKVLPTSKALKLYTTLFSTSMTNCFVMVFKRKLDKRMMNCDDHLRCFIETLIN